MDELSVRVSDVDLSKVKFVDNGPLNKMKPVTLTKALKEYYFGDNRVSEILKKYGIAVAPSDFSKFLPLVDTEVHCPYDGESMFSKLPSKAGASSWDKDIVCLKCGHIVFRSNIPYRECDCAGCIAKRKQENQKLTDLIRAVNNNQPFFEYANISLESVLDLAVILQEFHANTLDDIGIYERCENPDFSIDILKRLVDQGLIVVSENSPRTAFTKVNEEGYSYYLSKVNWDIWIKRDNTSEEDLLSILKNPNAGLQLYFDHDDVINNYRKAVHVELEKLAKYQFSDLSLDFQKQSDLDKMHDAFDRWLISLSPAQIYDLLWLGVRRVNDSRTRGVWGNYRYHQTDLVIKVIDEIIATKASQSVTITPFDYPYQVTQDLRTKILFGQIEIIPDWFQKVIPSSPDLSFGLSPASDKSLDDVEKLLFDDTSKISGIIEDAEWFAVTDFGLVVFDGLVEWLFTDQVSLYHQTKKTNTNENWWIQATMGLYYIDDFYSTSFILQLYKALLSAGVDERP